MLLFNEFDLEYWEEFVYTIENSELMEGKHKINYENVKKKLGIKFSGKFGKGFSNFEQLRTRINLGYIAMVYKLEAKDKYDTSIVYINLNTVYLNDENGNLKFKLNYGIDAISTYFLPRIILKNMSDELREKPGIIREILKFARGQQHLNKMTYSIEVELTDNNRESLKVFTSKNSNVFKFEKNFALIKAYLKDVNYQIDARDLARIMNKIEENAQKHNEVVLKMMMDKKHLVRLISIIHGYYAAGKL